MESRLPQPRLRRRIRRASARLLAALGQHAAQWLELEELLSEYHDRREQIHFDIGFEYGYAAGRGSIARRGHRKSGAYALAERARRLALSETGLSPEARALALLEAAWAVGFHSVADNRPR